MIGEIVNGKCSVHGDERMYPGGNACYLCAAEKRRKTKKPTESELDEATLFEGMVAKIDDLAREGKPIAPILRGFLSVWREGKFPDGTAVQSEATRKDAGKFLAQELADEGVMEELVLAPVLDAHLLCRNCQARMMPDPRVTEEDVKEALDVDQ